MASFPHTPWFRPQCFSHSRRVTPPPSIMSLFHLTATSGIHTTGGFPTAQVTCVSTNRALLSLMTLSCCRVAPTAPDPATSPSGLSSRLRSVAINRGVSPAHRSIPSCVFNSFGLFSEHLGDAFTPPLLMTLDAECSQCSQHMVFSISISIQPNSLSPVCLPV